MRAALTLLIVMACAFAAGYFSGSGQFSPVSINAPAVSPQHACSDSYGGFWTGFLLGSLVIFAAFGEHLHTIKRRYRRFGGRV
jgi:hypothetical protein